MIKTRKGAYQSIAFMMAFASMAYELVLAQSATVLYGGTVLRYSTVIGLFVFSLGMGAAFWAWSARVPTPWTFWKLELILAGIGFIFPTLVFTIDRWWDIFLSRTWFLPSLPIGYIVILAFAIIVGWLAGMELPILLLLAEQDTSQGATRASLTRQLIGLDFVGTVAATILIPMVAYPGLGLVGTVCLVSTLNGLLGWYLFRGKASQSVALNLASISLVAGSLLLFAHRHEVSEWLARIAF